MPAKRIGPLGWLGIALVVAIVLLAAFGVLNLAYDGGYYGMMGTGAWGWAVGMMAVPLAVLILVLVAALRGMGAGPSGSALDVVEGRYARGELSREEYFRIRADLTQGPSGPGGG